MRNERGEERQRELLACALVTVRRRKHEFAVLNLSSGGVMLEGDGIDWRIGETASLQLGLPTRVPASVRWVRERRVGLEFRPETGLDAPRAVRDLILCRQLGDDGTEADRRREQRGIAPRHKLVWEGRIVGADAIHDVRIRNISAHGVMFEAAARFPAGAELALEFDGGAHAAGTVVWSAGGQNGLRFDAAFDLRELAASRPEPAEDRQADEPVPVETGHLWTPSWHRETAQDLRRTLNGA